MLQGMEHPTSGRALFSGQVYRRGQRKRDRMGSSAVTVSGGYGVEVVFHEDGSVTLGDETCSVGERVHFIGNKCFSLLDGPTLLRLLGLLLLSVVDGTGFVEWSASYGILYSDNYRCWAVFSSDGGVEFNGMARASQC